MTNEQNVYVMRNFVAAIILRAVKDWVALKNEKEKTYHRRDALTISRNEIRKFLNSEWGYELCSAIQLEPSVILKKLEDGEFDDTMLENEEDFAEEY